MNGTSLNITTEKIKALKQILPEVFTEGKIDWEKLKATLGDDINFANERYVLNWAGKSEAFKVLQMPTTKTLIPAKDESINFDETNNIFIEGENLEVLKVLQKSYFGKIKMIYIDPPYNTGNDSFIYPDKFSETKKEYQERVGDKDEEGYMTKDGIFRKNSKENGQYHSNWLNMMMPRLYLAKNLLRQDGVIFISIDDNEVHNLRLLMNEIFGEENFVAELVWQKKFSRANDATYFSTMHDYILCYAKQNILTNNIGWDIGLLPRNQEIPKGYSNPDSDPRGLWTSVALQAKSGSEKSIYEIVTPKGRVCLPPNGRFWSVSRKTYDKLLKENRIWFGMDGNGTPRQKTFLSEVQQGLRPNTILLHSDVGHNQEGKQETKNLFDGQGVFDSPKPVRLLNHLSLIANLKKGSIVLDFFAGSASTAHAVMQLNKEDGGNRKYICVQLPELTDEKSEAYKAGYETIADIAKERIRRAGKKIKSEIEEEQKKKARQLNFDNQDNQYNQTNQSTDIDLGFKSFVLSDSNFKQWQQLEGKDAQALTEQMKLFVDPVAEHATTENILYELLLKSGEDINSTIETNDGYYLINSNKLALLLEKVSPELISEVISKHPQKVIALDRLFKGNDQLKTNTVLQMKDAGVEFKTI